PLLDKMHGKPLPVENLRTERKTGAAYRSPYKFPKYGQSGIEVSEIFPHVANHEPSLMLMNCGEARLIRPSMGSWITYGLGSENQNLPGFIVMCPGGYPIQESQNWQAGFLPGVFAGTYIDPEKQELNKLIEHVEPKYASQAEQRRQL